MAWEERNRLLSGDHSLAIVHRTGERKQPGLRGAPAEHVADKTSRTKIIIKDFTALSVGEMNIQTPQG